MSLYPRGKIWWSRIEIAGITHQFSTRCRNKNQARTIEAAKRTDLVKGLAGLTAPTIEDFTTRFINSLPGRVSKQTFLFYVAKWKVILDFIPLYECRLDKIDAALIEDFVQDRRRAGLSVVTINHYLRTLRRALHLAREWNLITKVPKVKLLTGEHQRDYTLTEKTVQTIAEEEEGLIGKLVPFLVDTGLRRGEVVGLRWEEVNLKERYLQVSRGKTKWSRRKVPLTKRAEKILKGLAPRRQDDSKPEVFLLNGHEITNSWIDHAFLRVRRRLKLPDDCVLHSTRHTFCTRLGERGADAFAIQRLAGHSSIVISQRYVHPSAGKLDAAIALLD